MVSKSRWLATLLLVIPLAANAVSWQAILEWFYSLNNENSAWAVVTKQTAVASNQIAANDVRTTQMLAVAMGTLRQTERTKDAVINYSGVFGQPESNLCEAISDNKVMIQTLEKQRQDHIGRMNSYSNRTVNSPVEQKQDMQAIHQDFCTISESRQGLCKLKTNGMQGWDSDYSGFSTQNNLGAQAEVGAIAYANTLTSQLPVAYAANECKSTACVQAKTAHLGNAARSSMVTNSVLSQISIRVNPTH